MLEFWKPVPGYPGVQASSLGRILLPSSYGSGRNVNKVYKSKPVYGYWAQTSKNAGRMTIMNKKWLGGTVKVARLVCLAFHGEPPPDKPNVLHIDEDSRNNRSSNLKWGTQLENLNAPGFLAYCRGRVGDNSPTSKALTRR